MISKFTSYILVALVALLGAPLLRHLCQEELTKEQPGLSPVACALTMLPAVCVINIFTRLENHQ